MNEITTEETGTQPVVSPVLRLVTHLIQKQNQMQEKIKPQAWILELLSGLRDQIGEAGLVYESHSGGSGFAFLRDRLAGSTTEERPVTRFHSARGFRRPDRRCAFDRWGRELRALGGRRVQGASPSHESPP